MLQQLQLTIRGFVFFLILFIFLLFWLQIIPTPTPNPCSCRTTSMPAAGVTSVAGTNPMDLS
jgi:hypothetical protein